MYQAIIAKVNVFPFPPVVKDGKVEETTNLQLANVCGFQVILGKEIQDGELGIFFPCDGQLSEEFANVNDLIKRKDETGKQVGGMFEENRRVKSLRLRGQRSDGFWCPLRLVEYTGIDLSSLKEGFVFTDLNDRAICNKYITQATRDAAKKANATTKSRKKNPMFPEHVETEQLRYYINTIPIGSLIHISEKEHGTSGRFGKVKDELVIFDEPNSIIKKVSNWFKSLKLKVAEILLKSIDPKLEINQAPFTILNGTRRVVIEKKDSSLGPDYYGEDGYNFRLNATKNLEDKLHPGESLYFELVGYTHNDRLIMDTQSTEKLKDKKLQKLLGDEVKYTYGCEPGQCRLRLYRVTQVSDDNNIIELPWFQVQARAIELGLETVRHITSFIYDGDSKALELMVNKLVDGDSYLPLMSGVDSSHPQEGVVLRVEMPNGKTKFFKQKSFLFGLLEGYLKDLSDFVDTEEAA